MKVNRWCVSVLTGLWVGSVCASGLSELIPVKPEPLNATDVPPESPSTALPSNHFAGLLSKAYQKDENIKSVLLSYKGAQLSPLNAIMENFIPQMNASGTSGYRRIRETGNRSKAAYREESGSLRVSQNLFNSGAGIAAFRSAKAQEKIGELEFQKALQDFLVRAVKAYAGVVTAQKVLVANKASEQSVTQQLEAAKVRAEVGEGTITDVALAEAELAKAAMRRMQAEAELHIASARYQEMFGELPAVGLSMPKLEHIKPPLSPIEAGDLCIKLNPDLHILYLKADNADRAVTTATAAMLPRVDANASASRSRLDPTQRRVAGTGWQSVLGADVTVTVPLFNNGRNGSLPAISQAQYNAAASRRSVQHQKEQLRLKALQQWQTVDVLSKSLTQNQAQVKAAQLRLQGAAEEFKVGSRAMLDVMDAESKFLEAQVALYQNEQRHVEALCETLQICGTLHPSLFGITEKVAV